MSAPASRFVVSFTTSSTTALFDYRATLGNYFSVLDDSFYLLIIRRTLLAAAGILGTCLVLGYPVAIVVSRMRPRAPA